MAGSAPGDDLLDHIADRILRGQDPDVEALIASNPDLTPASRDKLRKLAGAFGAGRNLAPMGKATGAALPFEKLGPYTLIEFMGEGGMGRVFLAEHEFLKRRVALKIIRPELAASPVTRQRFQREAMRIAKLRHENIVSVYDAGEVGGVAFLAMELVEGTGLDDLLGEARRTGERMQVVTAVRHARDVARALQCAHDAGIIHRDVKPSNVRITPDGRALLLDFGLSFEEDAATLSSAGHFHGTPQYASPEQIESTSGSIDARTDVYSLGVTLYECLTGRAPFAGGSVVQLFHRILSGDLVEPRASNGEIDAELNGIVMRAVSKDRRERFESAGAMAQALDAWLENRARVENATTRDLSRMDRSGRRLDRRMLVAALVVVCGAGWLWIPRGGSGTVAATTVAKAVVLPSARATTPLFGEANVAFDQRLKGWDPRVGPGTFGADNDGSGVYGISRKGISMQPRAVPGSTGRVRGKFMPTSFEPGDRTKGCGVGIEFTDAKAIALMLVDEGERRRVGSFEIVRANGSSWVRGDEIQAAPFTLSDDAALAFSLSWNETDVQFECGEPARADVRPLLVPRVWRGQARPSRFFLVVDTGAALFEDLSLEAF